MLSGENPNIYVQIGYVWVDSSKYYTTELVAVYDM